MLPPFPSSTFPTLSLHNQYLLRSQLGGGRGAGANVAPAVLMMQAPGAGLVPPIAVPAGPANAPVVQGAAPVMPAGAIAPPAAAPAARGRARGRGRGIVPAAAPAAAPIFPQPPPGKYFRFASLRAVVSTLFSDTSHARGSIVSLQSRH
jgi:hypothetical protein